MAKQKRVVIRSLVWVIVVAGAAVGGFEFMTKQDPLEITAAKVERGRVEETVSAISSGTVMATKDARISAEIMGKIISIPVEEGDHVNAGDVVLELNHEELDAQVRLAEANLEAGRSLGNQAVIGAGIYRDVAETQVSQAKAQRDQAAADLRRLRALYEQKAISRAEYDKVALAARVADETYQAALANQRQNETRQEEVKSSQSNIEQLEAAVEVARAMRAKATIRSPYAGVVSKILVDEGESVTPGFPLMQIVEDDERYVEAPFDEANAAQMKLGQHVRINLDAYRGADFPGVVTYIAPVVILNPDFSRTLNVKVRVEEDQEKFVPGMSADVVLLVDEKNDVLYVPSEAIIRQQYVYVVEDGKAVRREVKTGIGNWARTEVLEGLQEGDLVVTSVSIKELQPGVPIAVVEKLKDE
ncbi:MAG: efflux RND transporter periplasmic adaptor subunit [FCB group bacterium]|jgi:HlyD family secretion protein|nr:efflux RND transporter periplasmic adaptor subunit [FCB group bacterium]